MSLHPQKAAAQHWQMVDDLCWQSGHDRHDVSWYSRRLSLLAFYKAVEALWMLDASPGQAATWSLLTRLLVREEEGEKRDSFHLLLQTAGKLFRGYHLPYTPEAQKTPERH